MSDGDLKPYINLHGTLVFLNEKQIPTYEAAGYRLLQDGEIPPIQHNELVEQPAPVDLAETPSPDEIKALRRKQAAHDGV